jgi:HAMP domain-containing protein
MKLLTKFNLILLVAFGTGGLVISLVIHDFLFSNARREVMHEAELMMASARAVRDYTSSDIGPLLERSPRHRRRFLAETIPFYGAITTFDRLRKKYPDYTFQEAALNPTNPDHRATDWEADVISYLRNNPGQKEYTGERQTPMGPAMYLATPIIAEASCMHCHSRPAEAPSAMIATYGSNNGFGWKLGEIVAAEIVSVPTSVPVQNATKAFHLLLAYLVATLVATIALLDAGVYFIVIRPLKLVSDAADRISRGEMDPAPLPVKGKDEIATVTASFNRVQVSLSKAFKMLK